MAKKIFLLSVLSLFLLTTAFGQRKWTLQECIQYALDNNIDIKTNKLSVRSAEISNLQSKLDYLPSVSGGANYSFNTGRVLDPTTYTFVENKTVNNVNFSGSISTTLFAGMQKYNNLKKTLIELEATKSELMQLENNVSLNISLYYLQVLLNKEIVSSVLNQIESSISNIERMQKLVDAGSATRGDLLNLQAQKASEEYSLADAQTRLNAAKIDLCQLMALTDYESFDVDLPVYTINQDVFSMQVDSIFHVALSLPEVRAQEQRYEASAYDLKIAKSAYYPRLTANYGYGTSYSDSRRKVTLDEDGKPVFGNDGNPIYIPYRFFDQLRDNQSHAISLSLSVPIFNSLKTRNNVKIAKLNLQRAVFQIENVKNKLYKDVNQAVNDIHGARMQYLSAEAKLLSNKENMDYTEAKFASGASTITDYVLAKNNVLMAEAQMAQAKYNYIFKLEVINYYLGKGIGL